MGSKTPKYRMRRVTEAFEGRHPDRPRSPVLPRLTLECGHVVADGEAIHYSDEKAVQIRRVFREIAEETRRVRCYKCAAQEAS